MTAINSIDHRVTSFSAHVAPDCRVLILGTAPSVHSLAVHQVYAHPRNLFWPMMGEMFGAVAELDYAERIARLHARGVGIWDVLQQCQRKGSLDSAIIRGSEIANEIPDLLQRVPSIHLIAFNGRCAGQMFRRLVLPHIEEVRRSDLVLLDLPSTSPANAAMTRKEKMQRWRILFDFSN